MDRDQAKLVLSGFRGYEKDGNDPCFAEALSLVSQDQELKAWLEKELARDQRIAASLQIIEPSFELRDAILAGGKLDRLSQLAKPLDRSITALGTSSISWGFKIHWGIAAAIVLLLIGLGTRISQNFPSNADLNTDFGALLQQTALQMSVDHSMQISMLPSWASVKGRLNDLDYPITSEPPSSLKGARPLGCQTLQLGGKSVSLICFVLDNKNVAHLFLAPLDDQDSTHTKTFTGSLQRQGYFAESWTDDEFAYCLVFQKNDSHLTM